jgi:diguanylate cyclase (GGDEF)-like protein
VFIDLDNFKHVNDTQGHDAGDKALIRISEIIRTSIRKTDVAARFGGDEFLLLLHVDEVDEALLVCDKIVRSIDLARMDLAGAEKLGASLGVGYTRDESATFDSILKAADRACYEAKRLGKGQAFAIEVEQNPLIPLKV